MGGGTTEAVSAMASQATAKMANVANQAMGTIGDAMSGSLTAMFGNNKKEQQRPDPVIG